MANEQKEAEEASSSKEKQDSHKAWRCFFDHLEQIVPLALFFLVVVVIIAVNPNIPAMFKTVMLIGVCTLIFICTKGKEVKDWLLSSVIPGVKKGLKNPPLFLSIFLWCVAAVAAFLFVTWIWGNTPPQDLLPSPDEQNSPYEFVKIALLMVGGIGAVSYLVLKYQESQTARAMKN